MPEFRRWVKLVLFLSSYVPLFFIMSLKFGKFPPLIVDGYQFPQIDFVLNISWIMVCIIVLCGFLTWILYKSIWIHSTRGIRQKAVDSYQQRNELLTAYLLVYVFVFAGLDFTELLDFGIFLVFFVILGVLQIYSELLHVNPMLGIVGYRIYEVQSDEEIMLVISDSNLEEKLLEPASDDSNDQSKKVELVNMGPSTYLAP